MSVPMIPKIRMLAVVANVRSCVVVIVVFSLV